METQPVEKKDFFSFIRSKLKILVSLLFIILISVSIYSWLKYKSNIKKTDLSENYIQAKILLSQKNPNQALEVLEKIINKKNDTYSILSLYLIIDRQLEKDEKKILNYFDMVLSISNLKNEDLDLINLKKAIYISNSVGEQQLLDLLNPIINANSVWKTQAIKFLADFYYSRKEYSKANQYYSKLIDSKDSNIDQQEINRRIKAHKK